MVATTPNWAMLAKAWLIFSKEGPVWDTLRRADAALNEAEIPHAVVGGLSVFLHGHRRMTTDVDILVRPADVEPVRHADNAAVPRRALCSTRVRPPACRATSTTAWC